MWNGLLTSNKSVNYHLLQGEVGFSPSPLLVVVGFLAYIHGAPPYGKSTNRD